MCGARTCGEDQWEWLWWSLFLPLCPELSLASRRVGGASTSPLSFPKPEGLPAGGSQGACPQGSHAGWGLGLKGPGLTNFPICPQTMEYYCEACETAMCHECTVGEHREHVTVPLRDVVEQHKASLRQQLDAIKSRYCLGGLPTAAGPARGLGVFYSAAQLSPLRGPPCLPACHSWPQPWNSCLESVSSWRSARTMRWPRLGALLLSWRRRWGSVRGCWSETWRPSVGPNKR